MLRTRNFPGYWFGLSGKVPFRSASNWVMLANTQGTVVGRKHALREWLMANGFWETKLRPWETPGRAPVHWREMLQTMDLLVGKIRAGELEPLGSFNRLIDYMNREKHASSTVRTYRAYVLKFFRYSKLGLD